MTALERIGNKPGPVQVVLKAFMTKEALHDPAPDWQVYGLRALAWWAGVVMEARTIDEAPHHERELADAIVAGMRDQPVWGRILRGNAA